MAIHSIILAWRILMDRGAWQDTVHRVEKNRTPLKRLSMYAWPQDQILSWRHSESCGKGAWVESRGLLPAWTHAQFQALLRAPAASGDWDVNNQRLLGVSGRDAELLGPGATGNQIPFLLSWNTSLQDPPWRTRPGLSRERHTFLLRLHKAFWESFVRAL